MLLITRVIILIHKILLIIRTNSLLNLRLATHILVAMDVYDALHTGLGLEYRDRVNHLKLAKKANNMNK